MERISKESDESDHAGAATGGGGTSKSGAVLDYAPLPLSLRAPLLKTADGESLQGIRSGGRSAIVWDGITSAAYRLKGCGNYCDGAYGGKDLRFPFPGLPVVPMEKMDLATFETDAEAVEVRGCAFPHTAARELYMAERVGAALCGTGIPCALEPAAVWTYDIGASEPLPKMKKSCAVCRTLGERRLAAHAIPGIEMLALEHLLPFDSGADEASTGAGARSIDVLRALLPPLRRVATASKEYDVDSDSIVDREYPCVPTTMAVTGPEDKTGPVANPCYFADPATTEPVIRESEPKELVATAKGSAESVADEASAAGADAPSDEVGGLGALARRWVFARELYMQQADAA